MSQRLSAALAAAIIALAATAALAHPAAAQPPSEPGDRMERQERMMIIRHGDDEMGAGHADHLRAVLQLKPGQEGALTAYLGALHPQGDHEGMVRMHGEGKAKSTPEKLARMEARMTEHEAAMKSKIAATMRFYDQLDPAQKRAFDELPLMLGGPPMPMMGGMKIMHRDMSPMAPMPPIAPVPPRS